MKAKQSGGVFCSSRELEVKRKFIQNYHDAVAVLIRSKYIIR